MSEMYGIVLQSSVMLDAACHTIKIFSVLLSVPSPTYPISYILFSLSNTHRIRHHQTQSPWVSRKRFCRWLQANSIHMTEGNLLRTLSSIRP